LGTLVLDPTVPDDLSRARIFQRLPRTELASLVEGCRQLRIGEEASPLAFVVKYYPQTRRYSPRLLAEAPFQFRGAPALGQAVA
jgi:hypothetical protein